MKLLRQFIDTIVWGTLIVVFSLLPERRDREPKVQRKWRQRFIGAALLIAAAGVTGVLLVLLGLIPVKASSEHLPPVRWFFQFSKIRGFSTQSLGVEAPPDLNRSANVLKGAGQYETTCRPCHGSPELHHPRVAAAMTPHPPYLPEAISKYSKEELFSIIKHGIKFTGMPAWPAKNRDDEVWAMVAFLLAMPELDAAEYHQLAFGPSPPSAAAAPIEDLTGPENLPRVVRERCARCHGADGRGRGSGAFPKLAGQHAAYLVNSLKAYERGDRHSGLMEPVAAGLSDEEMNEMAEYYSSLEPAVGTHGADLALPDEGSSPGYEIAHRGVPAQKVPACADCHGPTHPHPKREYPMLAGQYAEYIVLQLELFEKGHRGGTHYAHLMQEVAPRLTKEQMQAVAAYYESLSGAGEDARTPSTQGVEQHQAPTVDHQH
ncbi:MAG: c-type cytochrome [Acidobacteria bacterium]|nr:c-type cytochrome [Acidobacteriota bacterium]